MRALIRDEEIIMEPFNKWTLDHLEWLTTPRPNGDGYKLINNYFPSEDEISEDPLKI